MEEVTVSVSVSPQLAMPRETEYIMKPRQGDNLCRAPNYEGIASFLKLDSILEFSRWDLESSAGHT